MTEQPLLPAPDETSGPIAVPQAPPRRKLGPWLYGLGLLLLAGAIFYVWQYPNTLGEASAMQAIEQHLSDIDVRISSLEQHPTPDVGKITARLDALDGRMADQTQLASRIDTLSGRIESLSGRDQAGIDASKRQIDALTSRVAAAEENANSLSAVSKRLNRIAKLQEASFALASGRPIGDLPNAPEALTRYAHTAPPTEHSTSLAYTALAALWALC